MSFATGLEAVRIHQQVRQERVHALRNCLCGSPAINTCPKEEMIVSSIQNKSKHSPSSLSFQQHPEDNVQVERRHHGELIIYQEENVHGERRYGEERIQGESVHVEKRYQAENVHHEERKHEENVHVERIHQVENVRSPSSSFQHAEKGRYQGENDERRHPENVHEERKQDVHEERRHHGEIRQAENVHEKTRYQGENVHDESTHINEERRHEENVNGDLNYLEKRKNDALMVKEDSTKGRMDENENTWTSFEKREQHVISCSTKVEIYP